MQRYKSQAMSVQEELQKNRSRQEWTGSKYNGSDSGAITESNSDMMVSRVPSSSPTLQSYSEITVEDEVIEMGCLRPLSTVNSSFSDSYTLQNLVENHQKFNATDKESAGNINMTDLQNIAGLNLAEYEINEQFIRNKNELPNHIGRNSQMKGLNRYMFSSSDTICNYENDFNHMLPNSNEHYSNFHQFSTSQDDCTFYNADSSQQMCYMTDSYRGDNTSCDDSPESSHFITNTGSTDLDLHYVNTSANITDRSRPYSNSTSFDNYLGNSKEKTEENAAGDQLRIVDKKVNYNFETSDFLPLNVDNFRLQRSSDKDLLTNSQEYLLHKQYEVNNNSEIHEFEFVLEKDDRSESPAMLSEHEDDENLDSPQRLVRSNSYILEAPSPQLLSHLKKLEKYYGSSDNNEEQLRKEYELTEQCNMNPENSNSNYSISSCGTEVTCTFHADPSVPPPFQKTSLSGNIVTSPAVMDKPSTSVNCLQPLVSRESEKVNIKSFRNESSNINDSIQSDTNCLEKKSYDSANNNENPKVIKEIVTEKCALQPVNSHKQSVAETGIEDMYLALQTEFRDQLIGLLVTQKRQQEELKQKFSQKQGKLLEDIRNKCLETVPAPSTHSTTVEREYCEVQHVSKDVNIHHSSIVSCVYAGDPSSYQSSQSVVHYSNYIYKSPNEQKLQPETSVSMRRVRKLSCSRQLFPEDTLYIAASRITAATRGYLVRRLVKTEHVQNLIYTIKDTLKYAHDVEQECLQDSATPSDVDLHRRLIQQVEAAYQNIHDIFFKFTVKERMAMICKDRELLRRRIFRPNSGQFPPTAATRKSLERKMQYSEPKKHNTAVLQFHRPCNFRSEKLCRFTAKKFNKSTASLGSQKPKDIKKSPRKSLRKSYSSDDRKPWH